MTEMLTCPQALQSCREHEPQIQAWAYLAAPQELMLDRQTGARPGALSGVAFGVKDVIDVAGMPTRSGSPATSSVPAELDATCVAQLREAGAAPIGKTVTAEFAYSSPGPTRNPHNPAHTPGGSSSGSAAAVAAGMVSMALGTQTGGSMIRPAAFCGVVGFKPTFGRVHRHGMDVLCDSLDTIGWFTQTVAQAARVANVLIPSEGQSAGCEPIAAGADCASQPFDPRGSDRAPLHRIAVLPCRSLVSVDDDAMRALNESVSRLQRAGMSVVQPSLDAELARLLTIQTAIMHAELARGLLPRLRASADAFSPRLRDVVTRGLTISYADYVGFQSERQRLATVWREQFDEVDIILTPSAPGVAPEGLNSTGSSVLNRVWSLLGWPCVHLPIRPSAQGLPLGVQCIALPDMDHQLLQWAAAWHPLLDQRDARLPRQQSFGIAEDGLSVLGGWRMA